MISSRPKLLADALAQQRLSGVQVAFVQELLRNTFMGEIATLTRNWYHFYKI